MFPRDGAAYLLAVKWNGAAHNHLWYCITAMDLEIALASIKKDGHRLSRFGDAYRITDEKRSVRHHMIGYWLLA